MIAYLIKSAVCLAVLLAAYHLFLEKEKMHRFSRLYLLTALVIGLTLPLLTLKASWGTIQVPDINNMPTTEAPAVSHPDVMPELSTNFTMIDYLVMVWSVVTALLLVRFTVNVIRISRLIRKFDNVEVDGATLILTPHTEIPNSFLKYIFVNADDYRDGRIEQEMLAHELVHVSQKHSWDILFIELLKAVFWFNPLFIFYKRAIQLNHEFLADEGVISHHDDVASYQQLLVAKAGLKSGHMLASGFNYSVTKKRLIMMRTRTTKTRAMLKVFALLPVAAVLAAGICIKAEAKVVRTALKSTDTVPAKLAPKIDPKKGFAAKVGKDGKYHYARPLNTKEFKVQFLHAKDLPKPKKVKISDQQLNAWKNGSMFGLWIDGKRVDNAVLNNYLSSDFVFYSSSKLMKNAINYGKHYYQVDLYTEDGFEEAFKNYKNKK